jgi:hypothetical protein
MGPDMLSKLTTILVSFGSSVTISDEFLMHMHQNSDSKGDVNLLPDAAFLRLELGFQKRAARSTF